MDCGLMKIRRFIQNQHWETFLNFCGLMLAAKEAECSRHRVFFFFCAAVTAHVTVPIITDELAFGQKNKCHSLPKLTKGHLTT